MSVPYAPFDDVGKFMRAAGQTTNADNKEQARLYQKLIYEEYEEFLDAIAVGDDAETLDACFDMMWVIIGYMKSRGWNCYAAWDEGSTSNLSKINPVTGVVKKREDGKILKPDDWQPPNFKQFV